MVVIIKKKILKNLFFVYTVLIILISVLPINSSGSAINHTFVVSIRLDYLLHCVIFIPWVFLFQSAVNVNVKIWRAKTLGWYLLGLLFAFAIELVQHILPYRAFNINDLLANGLGVVIGFVFIFIINDHLFRFSTSGWPWN